MCIREIKKERYINEDHWGQLEPWVENKQPMDSYESSGQGYKFYNMESERYVQLQAIKSNLQYGEWEICATLVSNPMKSNKTLTVQQGVHTYGIENG